MEVENSRLTRSKCELLADAGAGRCIIKTVIPGIGGALRQARPPCLAVACPQIAHNQLAVTVNCGELQ
jgi:hypothetical protein